MRMMDSIKERCRFKFPKNYLSYRNETNADVRKTMKAYALNIVNQHIDSICLSDIDIFYLYEKLYMKYDYVYL